MSKIFLPSMFICAMFWVIWIILYPAEVADALFFRHIKTKVDVLLSAVTWLFLAGFVATIVYLSMPDTAP